MELNTTNVKFHGDGGKYFGILAVNLILTIITLGLYYPWARAKNLQYIYGETEFAGSRFTFHGTGKEMFKGFIKAVLIIGILFAIYMWSSMSKEITIVLLGALVYLLGVIAIIPIAIHGGLRYRMSRTSWRGIHLGYRGKLSELMGIYFKGVLLTVLTLGVYGSWLSVNLRKYIAEHLRMGNLKFDFSGTGGQLFWINFKGILLLYPTLFIYTFWWIKNLNHFYINNMTLEQDGNKFNFVSNLTPGDIFVVGLTNNLLIIFTLGLGTPWAILRSLRMVLNNVELQGAFNADAVTQTEEAYTDATGEDMLDMLDIGLDF